MSYDEVTRTHWEEVRSVEGPVSGFGRNGGDRRGVEHVVQKVDEVDTTVYRTGGGVHQHSVTFEVVDTSTGGGHHHHGHHGGGNVVRFKEVDTTVYRTGGGVHEHTVMETVQVDTGTGGGHHHHGRHHHHRGRHGHDDVVVRVTRVEDDFDSSTGTFKEHKETFVSRTD